MKDEQIEQRAEEQATSSRKVKFSEMIRVLKNSIGEYKKSAIITPILVLFEVVFEVLIPFKTAELVDSFSNGAALPELLQLGAVLLLMALISLLFGGLAAVTCARASIGFSKNLRRNMFYQIQTFSFTTIDQFSNSSLVTRLTTDVTNVQLAYMMIIRAAVRSPFMMVCAFVAAWLMGGWISLIFLLLIPLLGIGLFCIMRSVIPFFRRIFKKYDALNELAEENLSGIRVIKSFVREDHERKRYDVAAESVRADFTKAERLIALTNPLMNLCVYAVFCVIIYVGSYVIISSQGTYINVGQFSSMITYGFMMLMNLMMLSMIFAMIMMAEEGASRIYEVLTAKTTILPPQNPVMEIEDGSVDFDAVSFSYNAKTDREALQNIDLHIASGETIGIIGSTGSSKSTLVQLIARLYDATQGTVRVGGKDVRSYDLDVLRNGVAMVLQKNVLFSGTIKENLLWGNAEATDDELIEAAQLAQADEFVQAFPDKYDTYIEQSGTNVSGGQRQRLCIARALLKKPKILILDDSTSAVDTKTDRLIKEGLKSYLPDTTKIIIAQRTSSVEDADRIIVMNQGHIDAIGSHETLLKTNEIYRDVYISQNKKSHDDKNLEAEQEVTDHE